jgi:hypothetical protein
MVLFNIMNLSIKIMFPYPKNDRIPSPDMALFVRILNVQRMLSNYDAISSETLMN